MHDHALLSTVKTGNLVNALDQIEINLLQYQRLVGIMPFQDCDSDFNRHLKTLFGYELPAARQSLVRPDFVIAWVAHRQWLLYLKHGAMIEQVDQLCNQTSALAALVDHTHGLVALRLSGRKVTQVLAKMCVLDLHPDVFPDAVSVTTRMAYTRVHLRRVEQTLFELLIPRSFAVSFWHWLTDSAAEFGYQVSHTPLSQRSNNHD